MDKFLSDLGKFAESKHVKHVAHKLSPITDALIAKGASKVQSLATGGRVKTGGRPSALVRLHKNEYILPAGVKPSKSQKKEVAKRRAKAKAMKK